MASHVFLGTHTGSVSVQQWQFGGEMEGGLREWTIPTDHGSVYYWGMLLDGLRVKTIQTRYQSNGYGIEMEAILVPPLIREPEIRKGPLVLEASRSDTVEALIQRCLFLERELEKARR